MYIHAWYYTILWLIILEESKFGDLPIFFSGSSTHIINENGGFNFGKWWKKSSNLPKWNQLQNYQLPVVTGQSFFIKSLTCKSFHWLQSQLNNTLNTHYLFLDILCSNILIFSRFPSWNEGLLIHERRVL